MLIQNSSPHFILCAAFTNISCAEIANEEGVISVCGGLIDSDL